MRNGRSLKGRGSGYFSPLGLYSDCGVFIENIWPQALGTGFLVEHLLNDSGCCIRNISDLISYFPTSRRNRCLHSRGKWREGGGGSLFSFKALVNGRALLLRDSFSHLYQGPVLRTDPPQARPANLMALAWLRKSWPPPCPP